MTKLSPYWVTGFSDGESTFSVRVYSKAKKNDRNNQAQVQRRDDNNTVKDSTDTNINWLIIPTFAIELHKNDIKILEEIKDFFGVGSILIRKTRNSAVYHVQSIKELREIIIPHFIKYPLITQKKADFILFNSIIDLLSEKKHFSIEGLNQIINIKSSMNNGLSDRLKLAFPNFKSVQRPIVNYQGITDPNWLVGFVDGEGNFYVNAKKNNSKLGYQIILSFSIYQHSRDSLLLSKFIEYLDCGSVEIPSTRLHSSKFVTYKFKDITEKIIPFFQKYPLKTVKQLNFYDFIKVSDLMKEGSHLTKEGIEKIISIKLSMNQGRVFAAHAAQRI